MLLDLKKNKYIYVSYYRYDIVKGKHYLVEFNHYRQKFTDFISNIGNLFKYHYFYKFENFANTYHFYFNDRILTYVISSDFLQFSDVLLC